MAVMKLLVFMTTWTVLLFARIRCAAEDHFESLPGGVVPLKSFPFANLLLHPCGDHPVNFHPLQPLSSQLLLPLPPVVLSDPAVVVVSNPLNHLQHSTAANVQWVRELRLDVQQAKQLVRLIYTQLEPSEKECGTTSSFESPLLNLAEPDVLELYQSIAITSAYLHLMVRDALESTHRRRCPNEDLSQLYTYHRLAGKLESILCSVFHLESSRAEVIRMKAESLVNTTLLHRYVDCSSRNARACLVTRHVTRILDIIDNIDSMYSG